MATTIDGLKEHACRTLSPPHSVVVPNGKFPKLLTGDRLGRRVRVHDRAQEVGASVDLLCDTGGNGRIHSRLRRHRKPSRVGRLGSR